ncbi:hypothetical protein DL93DRAFT_1865789 [Clavulina sp. PMI_390]|nr:hypothetical protein DL93DRAFT_1865789 [Clavulina sp. PMI_390]
MTASNVIDRHNQAVYGLERGRLCPILFSGDRIGSAESGILALHVPEGGLWDILGSISDLLGGKNPYNNAVDLPRLNYWIERGLVEQLLRFIIELYPFMDDLFKDNAIPDGVPHAAPGWQCQGAITALLSICSAYNAKNTSLDLRTGINQLQIHSMELFRSFSAMNYTFSTSTTPAAVAENVIIISKLCDVLSLLLIPDSDISPLKAFRADFAKIVLEVTMKLREFLTEFRLSPNALPYPNLCISPAVIHTALARSATMAVFFIRHMVSVGGLKRPNQVLGGPSNASGEGLSMPSITGLPVQRLVDHAVYVDHDTSWIYSVYNRNRESNPGACPSHAKPS